MEFKSSNEALDWMIKHPLKRVCDQYGNYMVYIKDSNTIESFWSTGEWEDEDGNYEPDYWNMDKYTPEEFVEAFDGVQLKTQE